MWAQPILQKTILYVYKLLSVSERSQRIINSPVNPQECPENFGISSKLWSLEAPRWAWSKLWDNPNLSSQDQVGQWKRHEFSKSYISFNTGAVGKAQSHPNPTSKTPPIPLLSQNAKNTNHCKSKGETYINSWFLLSDRFLHASFHRRNVWKFWSADFFVKNVPENNHKLLISALGSSFACVVSPQKCLENLVLRWPKVKNPNYSHSRKILDFRRPGQL